jgi:hypothetical protein
MNPFLRTGASLSLFAFSLSTAALAADPIAPSSVIMAPTRAADPAPHVADPDKKSLVAVVSLKSRRGSVTGLGPQRPPTGSKNLRSDDAQPFFAPQSQR